MGRRRTLGAVLVSALPAFLMTTNASAYTPEPLPWANCSGDEAAARTTLEQNLQPANGAQAAAGGPLTFSTTSGVDHMPLTFTIASTPALAGPPLDSGLVSPDATGHVAFTSTAAGAAPRTIYWDVSFSSSALASCAGLEPQSVVLPVRSLQVLAAAPPASPVPQAARQCRVPRLRGASLAHARALLKRAGCRLGRVARRRGGSGTPRVRSQSPGAGAVGAAGSAVSVTLGAPSHRRS